MSTITPNYTYIYYDVVDYTNSNVLSSYTLSNTPLTFIPDFTTSSVLSGATNISNKTLHWDFGDGSASTELNPTHHYQWPGIYNVTLTIFDGFGNAYDSTYSATVQIFNYISTQIAFQDYKSLIYDIPVGKLIDPLTINTYFSWQDYPALSAIGYTINLYASGAHGAYNYIPQTRLDKWSHLRTLSRFYTLSTINGNTDYVTIESIQPTVTEIYVNIQNNQLQRCNATDLGSVLTGVTGSCQFWYTDDIPTNLLTESSPIIIFASIDNSKFNDAFTYRTNAFDYISYPPQGFQNIDPAVFASVKTRYNPADHLSITTTGIDGEGTPVDHTFDIPPISWQDTEIPYVIKFKDSEDFTTKNYPPLSSSVVQSPSIIPQQFYDVQTGVVSVSGNLYMPLDGVTFYEDFSSQVPQSIGAFYKGYFIASQSTENCYLTASVNIKDQPYYLKDTLINWITIPQYNSAIRVLRQENINGYNNLTTITFSNSAKFNINANNVYALAVAPSGAGADNDYQTWFADPVGDQILKYDIYGNLLTTYQLSAMVTLVNNQTSIVDYRYPLTLNSLSAASPNDLTLDRKNNLWASLIDSGVVIKLDTASGLVTTIASPTTATNVTTLSSDYNSLSGFAGEDLYLPSSIDTDIDNNLWVAYTHPDYSALIKYQGENNFTTTATILTSIIFPSGISPEQIQIDRNSNVWVTAINHNSQGIGFSNRNDYLYKFDISGNLISGFPLSGFQQIGNLTIDGNQNAWVIQGAETLTKIDGVTKQTTIYIAGLGNNTTNYICSIGGITCDTSNDIWVINNFDKNLYVFDANLITTDVLNPKYTLPLTYPTTGLPVISSYTTPINVANNQYGYSDGLKEFQAYGDWNGYNWLNKYAAPVSTIRTITGASNLFNIYPNTGQYNIAKVNENWNAAGFYDSLRYQETLLDKQVFFDQFLGVIVGGLDAQPYELGKTVYEKIANFVNNNADISKANINELISFCQELTVEFDQYNLTLPPQLRRLVDLLSIKQSTLWGNNNKFTQNFNTQGTIISNSTYGVNLGSQIDPLTGVFTNGTPIVAQELFSDNFKLINNNLIAYYNTNDVIPLSSYIPDWGWGLVVPDTITGTQINNFYKFYNYNPVFNNTYYDNVINWNDSYTTLSPTNSSYSNWSSDSGIIQSLLSYELTMGLRLFTSAANITYNS
jgi:streptogramin lyase